MLVRSIARRLRFEITRRVNRRLINTHYRYAFVPVRDRLRVVVTASDGSERELLLRRESSDFAVFRDVFERLEFRTEQFVRHSDLLARYEAILGAGRRPLIIDAGANIGLSALYFRDVYPDAAIVCVEPELSNFSELSRHLSTDPLVLPLNAAVAANDIDLALVDPGKGHWGYRTVQAPANSATTVRGYSIPSLIELAAQDWPVVPFILKVDIEGFEAELFDNDQGEMVDRFYAIIIEPHDWLLPKQRTISGFLAVVAPKDRDFLLHGEHILSISNADPQGGL